MIFNRPSQLELIQAKSNAWMLTFVDTLSILITFFILIYASSNQKNNFSNQPSTVLMPAVKDLSFFYRIMQDKIIKAQQEQYFCLSDLAKSIIITIDAETLFPKQSSALKVEANNILSFIAEALDDIDNNIIINSYVEFDQERYDKFTLPLNRAMVLAGYLKSIGYEKNIETKGFTKKNIQNNCHLGKSQVIDLVINEQ